MSRIIDDSELARWALVSALTLRNAPAETSAQRALTLTAARCPAVTQGRSLDIGQITLLLEPFSAVG